MGADAEARQLEDQVSFEEIAGVDPSIERARTDQADEKLQALIRGLQLRYGIRGLPDISVPQAVPK